MDQYIGKLLDNRYEILERIGSGGMAVVYKARCHRLNRLVAIKILKSDLAQDAEFRRRFHDESQAVAMLSHPNIVAVYDVSKASDLDYIVMELIDGITLKQYMQKKGEPLNWRESLHFITQIMKGLSHAHSRGIIHRDIKPHNIMVLRDGSVKVADFGIARLTSAAQNTLTQEALGSVHYISPEQARGSHIDCRSDIYSAGVVLYEMTTGRLPYEGDSPVSVAIQHINSIPLSPREINPDIPEALEAITMKAMASDVNKRYASADAMLEDLEEFRKNPSISFDYTEEDLAVSGDEPTQVMEASGAHNLHSAMGAVPIRESSGSKRPRQSRQRVNDEEYDEDDEYEEDDEVSRRKRSKHSSWGSALPMVLAVCAIFVFLGGICYFIYTVLTGSILNPGATYTVPNLVGKQYEEVKDDKTLLGNFTVELGGTEVSDKPTGEIIDQTPVADPNHPVKAGNLVITVTVSGGNNYYVLENYVNRRARDVQLLLESKGIVVNLEQENSDTITQDFIISQSVERGTQMAAGEEITLVVSLGPERPSTMVTSLIGMDREQAERVIKENLKLKLNEVREVFDPDQPAGNVVWQSIEVGTEVQEGTSISIHISKGPDPNTVEPSPSPTVEPTPDVTPTPTPTPDVTPTPTPTTPPVQTVTKTITVELPADRTEPVHVVVTVGGQVQYDHTIDAIVTSPIYPPLEGSGIEDVHIYFDDVLVDSRSVDFSNG